MCVGKFSGGAAGSVVGAFGAGFGVFVASCCSAAPAVNRRRARIVLAPPVALLLIRVGSEPPPFFCELPFSTRSAWFCSPEAVWSRGGLGGQRRMAASNNVAATCEGAADDQGCSSIDVGAAPEEDGPTTNAEDQRAAAALRGDASATSASQATSASSAALAALPAVEIDEGKFKYVLLRVSTDSGEQRYLVRGKLGAEYHRDVAEPFVYAYRRDGFTVEILGGGRILHQPSVGQVLLYGFSYGFPWTNGASHEISAEVVRAHFPAYENVSWSNEGY